MKVIFKNTFVGVKMDFINKEDNDWTIKPVYMLQPVKVIHPGG